MLLTYNEFQKICTFVDKTNSEKYIKYYKASIETYLSDLIGSAMVLKLSTGFYPELKELVQACIATNIELMFVEFGNITITGEGSNTRQSDFTNRPDYIDKKSQIKSIYKVLRSFETQLLNKIQSGDYPESETGKLSTRFDFKITAIG